MSSIAAEPIRIVYFGTPEYAVPTLEALASDKRLRVPLVVSQPDRPAGRGRRQTPPAVKVAANRLGLPVYQPEQLRTEDDRSPIAAVAPDLFVVAAFGRIFGPKLLSIPRMGSINLHASNLPDFRGASPISAAILDGNFRTGVTLMGMDTGLDTGPMLAQQSIDIEQTDTTASLTPKLAHLAAIVLIDALEEFLLGRLIPVPQNQAHATITRPMVKADGWVDWSQPAAQIERQVRAMWDWPRAWSTLNGSPVQIHRASVLGDRSELRPGEVRLDSSRAIVGTGEGQIVIEIAQAAGGKPLSGGLVFQRARDEPILLGVLGKPDPPPLPLIRPVSD
jgi:methionyl-tRNA formyltransferase